MLSYPLSFMTKKGSYWYSSSCMQQSRPNVRPIQHRAVLSGSFLFSHHPKHPFTTDYIMRLVYRTESVRGERKTFDLLPNFLRSPLDPLLTHCLCGKREEWFEMNERLWLPLLLTLPFPLWFKSVGIRGSEWASERVSDTTSQRSRVYQQIDIHIDLYRAST